MGLVEDVKSMMQGETQGLRTMQLVLSIATISQNATGRGRLCK